MPSRKSVFNPTSNLEINIHIVSTIKFRNVFLNPKFLAIFCACTALFLVFSSRDSITNYIADTTGTCETMVSDGYSCMNGGNCSDSSYYASGTTTHYCMCTMGWTGNHCEYDDAYGGGSRFSLRKHVHVHAIIKDLKAKKYHSKVLPYTSRISYFCSKHGSGSVVAWCKSIGPGLRIERSWVRSALGAPCRVIEQDTLTLWSMG